MGPLKVEEVRSSHVKVKWDKPEDNGGTDITGYVLEKMDLETGRWIPAGEVGPNEKTFTFSGLTPKKKYKFRVKAVNKEGESEPLEVEEAIVAKNPYGKGILKRISHNDFKEYLTFDDENKKYIRKINMKFTQSFL